MKYPAQQFNKLTERMSKLSELFDLNSVHPCSLHWLVFQNSSPAHEHNALYTDGKTITHGFAVNGREGFTRVIQPDESFELYPDGCTDGHIETAVKKALAQMSK
jgi:hypothetical protein